MSDLVFVPDGHEKKFDEGWRKYGHALGREPIPDWYWDPTPGTWLNLPTSIYDVSDQNWPSVKVGPVDTPDYETLFRHWLALPRTEIENAYWDPGRGKWLRIVRRIPPTPKVPDDGNATRQAAIRAAKATILQLRAKGYIGPDTQRVVEDALDRELAR
jgi:hypothetical protein